MMRAAILALLVATPAVSESLIVVPQTVPEWKPVYATVAARRTVPARARIGGTIAELQVTEGQSVTASQRLGLILDEKLDFQLAGIDGRIAAARSQLDNARAELVRGEALVAKGVSTAQRLDALRTQVDVIEGQILALEAERSGVTRTQSEGVLLAPADGLVLGVPVGGGEVILPGETVATIGTGGFFLRLQVPERYADRLIEGAGIVVEGEAGGQQGKLAKVYPQIDGGRVQADVEVAGLDPRFVGARVAVRLPVGQRQALVVPLAALTHRGGLDFVSVVVDGTPQERAVVPGERLEGGGAVEIVSGLAEGDEVLLP